jgi:multidrug efflux pump subunit AcrA (membrane-fusion protein)
VTIGQALYEVAPLDEVVVEIAIPDDEYTHVAVDYEVTVRFDGFDQALTGKIRKIHPKSEVRNGDNVFVAEVVLSNDGLAMRPGMTGFAKVKSETHSLAWNLLHKPWEHLRQSLPF